MQYRDQQDKRRLGLAVELRRGPPAPRAASTEAAGQLGFEAFPGLQPCHVGLFLGDDGPGRTVEQACLPFADGGEPVDAAVHDLLVQPREGAAAATAAARSLQHRCGS